MSTFRLDLLFLRPSEADLPCPAISHVYVKTKSTHGYLGFDPETITLQCHSLQELEGEIDSLHGELEEIRKMARRKYARYHRKAL